MNKSLLIIDDFYPNFDEIRAKALAAEYEPRNGIRPQAEVWPGFHSKQRFVEEEGIKAMQKQIAKPLYWHDSGTCNLFRYSPLKDTAWHTKVHIDPTDWVGVVYLNTPEQARQNERCGTSFYRHIETNTEIIPKEQFNDYYPIILKEGWKSDKWVELINIPMKSNRMVIFQGKYWHSHSNNFGTTVNDSRLIHLFLLNEGTPPPEWREGAHCYG